MFGTDQYDIPTGQLVMGLPTSLTLDPGQSIDLSFGLIGPGGYELALANVAPASDPSDIYRVAAADVFSVPEPSTFVMSAIGILCMLAYARRRRNLTTKELPSTPDVGY